MEIFQGGGFGFFFFPPKRGVYSSPAPSPTLSHQDTPFSGGRPSSDAYYSRTEVTLI